MSTDKNEHDHSLRGILRSTSVMSLGTLVSRGLGFVRDIIFAHFFGTAAGADAFVVAFRLPNLFRDLVGEGAANSSFVPVMTEYKDRKPEELAGFLNVILVWAFIVLCAITLVCIVHGRNPFLICLGFVLQVVEGIGSTIENTPVERINGDFQ